EAFSGGGGGGPRKQRDKRQSESAHDGSVACLVNPLQHGRASPPLRTVNPRSGRRFGDLAGVGIQGSGADPETRVQGDCMPAETGCPKT
ncbi:MAG: hypothetical protein L7F78_06740, partial [Syntrophales bacterium LBB04]|nr:hypothetical protein [Syntrophales bacterium LBB04]